MVDGLAMRGMGRMMLMGLKAGAGYGLAQDAVGWLGGRRPGYLKMFGLVEDKRDEEEP